MIDSLSSQIQKRFGISQYFLTGGFWLSIAQVMDSAASFVLAIALSQLVTKETFGEYRYLLSIASIIGLIGISGYNIVISQVVAQGDDSIWWKGVKKTFLSGLVGSLVGLFGGVYYVIQGNYTLGYGLFIIAAAAPFLSASQLYTAYLTGKKKFKALSIIGILPDIGSVCLLITAAVLGASTLPLLVTFFLSNIVLHSLASIITRKISPQNEVTVAEEDTKYPIHLSGMNLMNIIGQHIDKIITFQHLGAAPVAILAFAQAFPNQIKAFQKIILALTLPTFSESRQKIASLRRKILQVTLVSFALICVYIVFAPFIYGFIFPNYAESIFISQIFALSMVFMPTIYLLQSYLSANTKTGNLYKNTLISNVASITCTFVGIYFFGLLGAAVAAIIVNGIIALNLIYLYKKN
jgi:O-antigen/teichoic acid export membrane protein